MTLKDTNKVVEASRVYYNSCIPAHPDGRTPYEFLKINPPAWLKSFISQHRVRSLSSDERTRMEQDASGFHAELTFSIMKEVSSGRITSSRGRAIIELMRLLSDPMKLTELRKAERKASGMGGGKIGYSSRGRDVLEPPPRIIVPFVSFYRTRHRESVMVRLISDRLPPVTLNGERHDIEVKEHGRRELGVYAFSRGVGTRIGMLIFDGDGFTASSLTEERHRALRDLLASYLGDHIEFIREARDVPVN